LSCIEGTRLLPELARIGTVQPKRHAKTAIQSEIPVATTARKV
jgi:hypothetical protein